MLLTAILSDSTEGKITDSGEYKRYIERVVAPVVFDSAAPGAWLRRLEKDILSRTGEELKYSLALMHYAAHWI